MDRGQVAIAIAIVINVIFLKVEIVYMYTGMYSLYILYI